MKQGFRSRGFLFVEDPCIAQIILDSKASRFLEPFIGQERNASTVAKELGVTLSSLNYRIRQFLKLGVLSHTRTEPRHGRAVKYYRAVADGFFVPFEVSDSESVEVLERQSAKGAQVLLEESLSDAWSQIVQMHDRWGIRLTRDEAGVLDRSLAPATLATRLASFAELASEPHAPIMWDQYSVLELSEAEAEMLRNELSSLYSRYFQSKSEQARPYIVRLAMAPAKLP